MATLARVVSPRPAGRTTKGVYVEVNDHGATIRLTRYADHIANFAALWPAITEGFVKREEIWFTRQGEGTWPPLSSAYRDWKLKTYGAKPLLVRTGDLKESLTNPARAILAETDHMLVLGSDVDYAGFHQAGTQKMPARPPLAPLVRIMAGVARVLEDWVSYPGKDHLARGAMTMRSGALGSREMLGSYVAGD